MKRAVLSLAVLLAVVVFVSSCRDEQSPTAPELPVEPSLSLFHDPATERVSQLIEALYPKPVLYVLARIRWHSIQTLTAWGREYLAQRDARQFTGMAVRYAQWGMLLDPDGPGLPETTEEAVAELITRVYAYVGLTGSEAQEDNLEFFQEVFGEGDSGVGVIEPDQETVISTGNNWAALVAPAGATEEPVYITIDLLDEETCEVEGPLVQALGCWKIQRYPEGDFAEDVQVEICIADTDPSMAQADWDLLRVHEKDDATGAVRALPFVEPQTIDCTGFDPLAPSPSPGAAAVDTSGSLVAAVGSGLLNLLLPEPLAASFLQALRRPPRGLGGLTGSFSEFFGAVSDLEDIPVGTGPADTWEVQEPSTAVDLCREADPADCPAGSETSIQLSAVATGPGGTFPSPWDRVYFYHQPQDGSDLPTLIGQTSVPTITDAGGTRFYTWTATLEGQGLPGDPLDVFAVGARVGSEAFRTPANTNVTVVPSGVEPVLATRLVGAGGRFSCSLRSDGQAFCWGSNARGQLGDGTQTASAVPVSVSGGYTFESIYVGHDHACGLTASGTAYCWGGNASGQLGAGLPTAGEDNFSRIPVAVAGGHSFATMSLGLVNTCGVATDGVTYCWGGNAVGNLGNGTTGGQSNVPVPVVNSDALGFVAVTNGFFSTCALDANGSVFCWGDSGLFGNDPTGPDANTPVPAASGLALSSIQIANYYTCGIDGSAQVLCWGSGNASGEQGNGTFVAQPTPTTVVGGLSFEALDAQNDNSILGFTCGLTDTGDAWCWGSNREGQLGGTSSGTCIFNSEDYDCSSSPVAVAGSNSFASLAVGMTHACALGVDENVYCWGENNDGQLGDGTVNSSTAPVLVAEPSTTPGIGAIQVTPYVTTLTLLESTVQLTAEARDLFGNPLSPQPSFTWTSDNPGVAAVDASGLVTALSSGTAIIRVNGSNGAEGRTTVEVAIVDPVEAFRSAFGGGGRANSVVLGGLLTDEWGHSGTFPGRTEVDRRSILLGNLEVQAAYDGLNEARIALEWELSDVSSPRYPEGQLWMLAGYTSLFFAENWCSGVPLDDPAVGLSTADLLLRADQRFQAALDASPSTDVATAARVGLARVSLQRGDYAPAAATASTVPTGFAFDIVFPGSPGEVNAVYTLNTDQERITVSDAEGGNGLPFRSAGDPRVPWTLAEGDGVGFDRVTPQYDLLKYASPTSPIPLATGFEARLIQAEARVQIGDFAGAIDYLNELRATNTLLPPLAVPSTPVEMEDLLFAERAFWLFATGHRLPDLRRLINGYGRSASSLFPTGTYHKGGVYGTDANLPVPESARGPGFTGCTVRGG